MPKCDTFGRFYRKFRVWTCVSFDTLTAHQQNKKDTHRSVLFVLLTTRTGCVHISKLARKFGLCLRFRPKPFLLASKSTVSQKRTQGTGIFLRILSHISFGARKFACFLSDFLHQKHCQKYNNKGGTSWIILL